MAVGAFRLVPYALFVTDRPLSSTIPIGAPPAGEYELYAGDS